MKQKYLYNLASENFILHNLFLYNIIYGKHRQENTDGKSK